MVINKLETQSVLNFLDSLRPPVHVILIYGEPSELEDIESEMTVQTLRVTPQYVMDQVYSVSMPRKGDASKWVFHRVEPETLSNIERLIGFEERMRETRQPPMALCAYPLKQFIERDTSVFVEILSLHDYVLFSRFEEGQKMMLKAMEEALQSTLGRSGSEMIYSFAQQMGIYREQVPSNLRRFRSVLQELLGIGANFLERLIFKRLYLKLRSCPQVVSVDG